MSVVVTGAFAVIIAFAAQVAGGASVQSFDGVEMARRMASTGAIDLALQRVNQAQAIEPVGSPQWLEWELLHLDLLGRRGRNAEVLKRIALTRNVALPDRAAAQLWLMAARSAQRLGESAQARAFYASYFLGSHALPSEYRDARLAVINSYLADSNVEDAYRSMLRFQQDFSPLRAEEAERFASGLIAGGRISEAVTWLPQLDKTSPAAAMLRMRTGLITADAAAAQARALLAKGAGDAALDLLASAASAQKNRAVEIEVQEHRLQLLGSEMRDAIARHADSLWNLYGDVGQQTANQAQLLVGDDAAWIDRAMRMLAQQPQAARALLGRIAVGGGSEEARARAQSQLIASLRDAKLALTALRLFADPRKRPVASLHPNVRLELGTIALAQKDPVETVRFWQGLPQPPGLGAPEWQLRNIAALFAAGMTDAGLEAAKSLLASSPSVPEVIGRLIVVASNALERWQARPAESLLSMILPLAHGPDRINVLLGLGKARELRAEYRGAADAYSSAAAMYALPEGERESLRARESAAINLAKAGLLDDARATYQWLAANAKDPAIRENATRALKSF